MQGAPNIFPKSHWTEATAHHFLQAFQAAVCFLLLFSLYLVLMIYFLLSICRDGVSEGQFYQVLLYELDAIRKVRLLC